MFSTVKTVCLAAVSALPIFFAQNIAAANPPSETNSAAYYDYITVETGGWTNCVCWSGDGRFMATAASNGSVRMWDRDGNLVRTFVLDSGAAQAAAFSPDGKSLAAGGDSGLFVYPLAETQTPPQLTHYTMAVKTLAWSPDGKFIAAASIDGSVALLDAVSLTPLKRVEAHDGDAVSLSFSPDGKLLASSGYDRSAKIWKLPGMELVKTLQSFYGNVNAAVFSPDGKSLAVVSADRSIQIWQVADWQRVEKEEGAHKGDINAAAWSPDGKFIATGGDEGLVRIWRVEDLQRVRAMKNYNLDALSLAFSPDGEQLAAGYLLGIARIWNWKRERAIVTVDTGTLKNADDKYALPAGTRLTLRWDKIPGPSSVYAESEHGHGRIKRSSLGFSDRYPPVIRVTGRSVEGHSLLVTGVVYDDCAVASVTANGREVEWVSRKTKLANYSDAFTFVAKIPLRPGSPPVISAIDYAGHRSSMVVGLSGEEYWAPKQVELKTVSAAKIMDGISEQSNVLRTVDAGTPLLAVGYRKTWYKLNGGGWISSDLVTGR